MSEFNITFPPVSEYEYLQSPVCAVCCHSAYDHMLDPGDGLTGACLVEGCEMRCIGFVEESPCQTNQ
jgi:hypothetical protein